MKRPFCAPRQLLKFAYKNEPGLLSTIRQRSCRQSVSTTQANASRHRRSRAFVVSQFQLSSQMTNNYTIEAIPLSQVPPQLPIPISGSNSQSVLVPFF